MKNIDPCNYDVIMLLYSIEDPFRDVVSHDSFFSINSQIPQSVEED